jgi:subtilisin family serine protease
MEDNVKKNSFFYILFLVLFAHLTDAEPISKFRLGNLNQQKMISSEKILTHFESDQDVSEVIITLTGPDSVRDRSRLKFKQTRQVIQQEIRAIQEYFSNTMTKEGFLLRRKLENQLTISAFVTFDGLEDLTNHPLVEAIEPVIYFEPHLSQGISLINASEIRSIYGGQGVSIAICDTGVDYTHPYLGGGGFPNDKVIGGCDIGDNDMNPIPDGHAHGTCCAGIAAGDPANIDSYIGGVAHNAKIYAIKITSGSSGNASNADIAEAWDWCVTHQYDNPDNPILIISTSFGGGSYYDYCDTANYTMKTAAENAVAAGITLLASSGNDGYCNSISSPACLTNVISVGAVYDGSLGTLSFCVNNNSCAPTGGSASCDSGEYSTSQTTVSDMVTHYSNTDDILDILAPSHNAYTTDIVGSGGYSNNDYYTSFGGTSAACPYAAGAVACLQSAAKHLTGSFLSPTKIKNMLISTGDLITDNKVTITKPRVNLGDAIDAIVEVNPTPPIAHDQYLETNNKDTIFITLNAEDDGRPIPPDVLNYKITSIPTYGVLFDPAASKIETVPYTLVANGNKVKYVPITCYSGTDSFTFIANDSGTAPDGGDSNEAIVSLNISLLVYSAAMDTDPGWTFDGDSLWEWGTPQGLGGGGGAMGGGHGNTDPTSGYTGANVIGYNLVGDYSDNMSLTKWATTPMLDCSGFTDVKLAFYRWLNVEQSFNDHAYIAVSTNGTSWITVWENTNITIEEDSWNLQEIDISQIADNQPTVYVRWGMGPTDSECQYSGWNLDDVIISGQSSLMPTAGDFEPDCDVDMDDLTWFISFWLESCGNCEGTDLLKDGIVNLADLAILAENWLLM